MHRARQVNGMSGKPAGIAPSEVIAWLDLQTIDAIEKRRVFADCISALDGFFLSWASTKAKEGKSKGAKEPRGK